MNEDVRAEAPRRVSERRVPKFGGSQFSSLPPMNRLQRSFYTRDFRPGVLERDPVEVNGQPGFALQLREELIEQRASDPAANEHLRFLAHAYRDRRSFPIARETLADTYFFEGDTAGGYRAYEDRVPLATHLALAPGLGFPRLLAATVMWWAGAGALTRSKHGLGNVDAIMNRLQQRMDAFHDVRGMSVIDDFWRRLCTGSAEDAAGAILPDVIARYDRDAVRHLVSYGRSLSEARASPSHGAQWEPQNFSGLFDVKFRSLMRQAEDETRSVAGVPAVGQGWVSEMTLLRELEAAFPDESIVHQARPYWLAPQSLDVFFPEHCVAVEHQGAQHSRPVEHFGGAQAYERQIDRDSLKRDRVQEVGGVLIEVHPGYRLADVVEQVRAALNRERA